ncbi:MAG: hypothetical protein FWG63_02265 [Defluviitaleaceae bacterium]|nr:hypothetical protein [Defluviitaleaceae bacterium]
MAKTSESLSDFLNWFSSIEVEYTQAQENQREADKKQQDVLHKIEIDISYDDHEELMKAAHLLKFIREERRCAKDKMANLFPIKNWAEKNKKVINELKGLLGQVRKVEKEFENRNYNNRSSDTYYVISTYCQISKQSN